MKTPYWRNDTVIDGINTAELTKSNLDATHYYNSAAKDKDKQEMLNRMMIAAQNTVGLLRARGYNVSITRSVSEGAIYHGTGYALDISTPSRNIEDAYEIADIIANDLQTADQVWIEASDYEGNYHVHVLANPDGYNPKPILKTIYDVEAKNVEDGLLPDVTTYSPEGF